MHRDTGRLARFGGKLVGASRFPNKGAAVRNCITGQKLKSDYQTTTAAGIEWV